MTSLGARFESERDRLRLTRAELHHECGYSVEQIRKVENDLSEPGAGLLAGLMRLGGNLRFVLLGDDDNQPRVNERDSTPYSATADEMAAARYRDQVRLEAREHAKLKNDRRKRVVTDQEADLLDAFRDLSRADREAVVAAIAGGRFEPAGGKQSGVTVTGSGNRTAGGSYYEGK